MNNIAIFASGSGSNAENLINHFSQSNRARVKLILTENPKAFVIQRANRLKISSHIFTMEQLKSGEILELLKQLEIDFIVLAGFLKLLPQPIVETFGRRVVNIHPALLPKYGGKGMYGMNVHRAVIASKEIYSGITIHIVNTQYDEGDILFQAKCDILPSDTPETLAERIHALEYEHFPKVVEGYINKFL
ncbi:MAG: phosphoribosylglycinamide formyltransferase [Bacteroidales bacterium]|nr:phosphoribosylglycinamide formyltransferase [Bacteroidales bacterium]MDY0199307.1 phosphoribosylglycinamide formyltransferase [Tenuifilaceae bacterium]